ncbi:hypothetical protein BDY24DRAFT_412821 [Mrakia frigida]|uniref:uncharacterized protein n=1 Tax=Mrakia frigida TaxID=29902 RepID=UPI003FCC252B
MPILESIALWSVCTLVGTWFGHEGRENYQTDTPSKRSNATNLIRHCRETLGKSAPPSHSFLPPLGALATKQRACAPRDFVSMLKHEERARMLVEGDERLGVKNVERASAYARQLWIQVNENGNETFSYPGSLSHHEARKYVCTLQTGLLWADEDLPAFTPRRRRVDSFGSQLSSVGS